MSFELQLIVGTIHPRKEQPLPKPVPDGLHMLDTYWPFRVSLILNVGSPPEGSAVLKLYSKLVDGVVNHPGRTVPSGFYLPFSSEGPFIRDKYGARLMDIPLMTFAKALEEDWNNDDLGAPWYNVSRGLVHALDAASGRLFPQPALCLLYGN